MNKFSKKEYIDIIKEWKLMRETSQKTKIERYWKSIIKGKKVQKSSKKYH